MYFKINTERLVIRPISTTDAAFMLHLTNSKGWLQYIGDRKIYSLEDAQKYIEKIQSNSNFFYHILLLKNDETPIGIITFLKRDTEIYPDFGFAILPAFESKGYVFEASKTYLSELFKLREFDKIIAITLQTNQKSINLLERLGFQFTNIKQDDEQLAYYQFIT